MKVIEGDLLLVEEGVIAHQTNGRYVMGAGLARKIANKWPGVLKAYQRAKPPVGWCQTVQVSETLWVANLVGQAAYGSYGRLYTDYKALESALGQLFHYMQVEGVPVFLPYKIGCGYGGGDWAKVSRIIQQTIPDATIIVPSQGWIR